MSWFNFKTLSNNFAFLIQPIMITQLAALVICFLKTEKITRLVNAE